MAPSQNEPLDLSDSPTEPVAEPLPIALHHHVQAAPDQVPFALQGVLSQVSLPPGAVNDPILSNLLQEPLPTQSLLPIQVVAAEPEMIELEKDKRLSESMLWPLQLEFYASQGISAWETNVPFFITNSAFIAESYADLTIAFLRDSLPTLRRDERIYLLEIASGTGRFSFHFVRELSRKLQYFSDLKDLDIKVVMTDFTETNIAFWEAHEGFAPFIASGFVDFAIFMPEESQSLHLRRSGETVSRDTLKNPLIVMANYFFDSVRSDVFRAEGKQLSEGLVHLHRKMEGVEPGTPVVISQIDYKTVFKPVYQKNYYDNPRWNAILNTYRHNIKKGGFLFPMGALRCVENLLTLANNRLVLISSDKAFTTTEEMAQYLDHTYAIHGGAFSFMMNYDAVGRYFENAGGRYLYTRDRSLAVQTICCVLTEDAATPGAYETLRYLFEEKLCRGNPINSLNDGQAWMTRDINNTFYPIGSLISFIRLNLCDPKAFANCAPKIIDVINSLTWNQRQDLVDLMAQVRERYYFFRGEVNLPFWLGQIYYYLGLYEQGLTSLQETVNQYGEHPALDFLMGQCCEALHRETEARRYYEGALTKDPNFSEAQQALDRLSSYKTG